MIGLAATNVFPGFRDPCFVIGCFGRNLLVGMCSDPAFDLSFALKCG